MWLRSIACFKTWGRLCAASLWLFLLVTASLAVEAGVPGDEFLTGYVASILEQDLNWSRASYSLEVLDGVATLTLHRENPERRWAAEKALRAVDGLQKLIIAVAPENAGQPGIGGEVSDKRISGRPFPSGDLFLPLLADPKQPQFFASMDRFETTGARYTMSDVGFGETFGLYRFLGDQEGDGLQLSVEASLVARFNMSTPSHNLINADYTVGIPLTFRRGENSIRFRLYHQSSHLGDEYLQGPNPPKRINLSYEAIEFLYSREWHGWRGYLGGEYLIFREPADLKPGSAHWGLEYRGRRPVLWKGRFVGAVDWKSFEEHAWAIDTSIKVGLEFGQPNPGKRRLRLMAEWYRGFDPRGQFYMNRVSYFGLNASLGF